MEKIIMPSDAFAVYERAFRAGSPREVEELLREMLNVQVAVVESKKLAERELLNGKRLLTISIPYRVLLDKWGKSVRIAYRLQPSPQNGNRYFLVEVKSDEDIRPNFTYVLLAEEAGYSPEKGLTFEGGGSETGFEPQPNVETCEKTTTGRFQTWEEHAKGVWERFERIVNFYRPFIERWTKEALSLKDRQMQSFVDSLIWAMRIAVYLHDVGKLNKRWQEIIWEKEEKLSGMSRKGYIARTSPLINFQQKKDLASPPPHAPFAYSFLRALLRKILGDYPFLDTIALATARHHSLEVSGVIEEGKFEWDEWNDQKADEWLLDQVCQILNLSKYESQRMQEAFAEAAKKITEASEADEPPGPTDCFYFLYCIVNRIVKVCDWEDAGNKNIELCHSMSGLPNPITLQKGRYLVYKTGLPFYDAIRLIGVAHFFFGTGSAEVEDKGAYWEVKGVLIKRDKDQISWVINEGESKAWDFRQKKRQIEKAFEDVFKGGDKNSESFDGLPIPKGKAYPALKEFDAAVQYGPRGIDPLSDPVLVNSQGTKPKKKEKQYRVSAKEFVCLSLGFSFSAFVISGDQRLYILPVFRERFVLSGSLTYNRNFTHYASSFVAGIMGAISILLDLIYKKLPVQDFVYTRIWGRNISSSSGYLGLEKLCVYWWDEIVEKENQQALQLLKNFRQFLHETKEENVHEQVQDLTRWVANFIANPSVDALVKIEQLKTRILAASQNQNLQGAFEVRQLLGYSQTLQEVKNMMAMQQLPEIPLQVTEALARALSFDEKGWMNQFTRLENAEGFSQCIQQIERIVARGFYREQQEQGQVPNISEALTRAKCLANNLRDIELQLRDEKTFRAWKAIFLLDVLSRFKRSEISTSAESN